MQHIFVGTSILFPIIKTELNLDYTAFGAAVAVSALVGGLFQVIFGVASRRIARHVLMGLGNLLLSLGTFLTSLSQSLLHFTGGRTVSNIGVAPQHPMGTAIITERFEGKSIGRAIGIHYGFAYVGNIIGPLFMTFLAIAVGWRGTLVIFSVPALIVGLTVIWYLNEDKEPTRSSKVKDRPSLKADMAMLLKTRSVIPVIMTQALVSGGVDLGIITTYTPLFLANGLKLDEYARGIIYTIGLVGGVIGPVLLGKYAYRIGYLKTATISTCAALTLVYLLALYDSVSVLLVAHLFVLGFVSFALPTLLQSHLVGVTHGHNRDLVIGLFFGVNVCFGALWTGVMGVLIDTYSSFKPAFILMGTLGLSAAIVLVDQMRKQQATSKQP
jgi:DHA1 family bicyclomycin/chloramphenicol resistance-like MFS transporter